MSNIGTTLRALNQTSQAEQWWKKAIDHRPTYFDAIENLCKSAISFVLQRTANRT